MYKLKSNKTFNDIVLGFNTMVEELEDLIDRYQKRVEENAFQIAQLQAENAALKAEADKALVTAERIKTLLD